MTAPFKPSFGGGKKCDPKPACGPKDPKPEDHCKPRRPKHCKPPHHKHHHKHCG